MKVKSRDISKFIQLNKLIKNIATKYAILPNGMVVPMDDYRVLKDCMINIQITEKAYEKMVKKMPQVSGSVLVVDAMALVEVTKQGTLSTIEELYCDDNLNLVLVKEEETIIGKYESLQEFLMLPQKYHLAAVPEKNFKLLTEDEIYNMNDLKLPLHLVGGPGRVIITKHFLPFISNSEISYCITDDIKKNLDIDNDIIRLYMMIEREGLIATLMYKAFVY